MAHTTTKLAQVLLFCAAERLCALPVDFVVETMRPLALESSVGGPPFVVGVSMIRGEPTPIVDMGALLAQERLNSPSRLILLRFDDRQVGLLVSSVLGVRPAHALSPREVPPLLQTADSDVVDQLGSLDDAFLAVLRPGRILDPELWRELAGTPP